MDSPLSITLWNVVLVGALVLLRPLVRDIAAGFRHTISNFDAPQDEGVFAPRLAMVRSNQIEALVLWVPVVGIAALGVPDLAHPHLSLIATIFLIACLTYVAVSLAGIPLIRSAAWTVSFAVCAYLTWIVATATRG